MGAFHARALSRSARLFFQSRTPADAVRLNRRFRGAGVLDSFEDVLCTPSIDAVVLCTPPQAHKEQVVRALQAGKSVLVEKPLCLSPEELAEIERAVGAAGRGGFLMVAENYYYKPALLKIRALLAQEAIGPIRQVTIKKRLHNSPSGWRRHHGALLEGGIHFVALLSDLLDAEPVSVRARFPGYGPGMAERQSLLDLTYAGGARALLDYSWQSASLTRGLLQHSTIAGSKGRIVFESNGLYLWLSAPAGQTIWFCSPRRMLGYAPMLQDFLACLADRSRRPYSDFRRARRDVGIVFTAYEQLGRTPPP